MSEKKHIDRLFQESFKDFEADPSDLVWTNIEAELKAKKKKYRIIPLWWRYAGVAALLLVFLSIGGVYLNNSENTTNNKIVDIDDNLPKTDVNANNEKSNTAIENNGIARDNALEQIEGNRPLISSSQSTIVTSSSSKSTTEANILTNTNRSQSESNKNTYAGTPLVSKNSSNPIEASVVGESKTLVASETMLTDEKKQKRLISESSENGFAFAASKKETENVVELKQQPTPRNGLTIEETLDKNKDIIPDDKPENRWSVAPNIAPVYFNTLNEGSSIDRQFNSNSKTGDVNMSYGIATSYAINKKFKVRSGINKVNLGYNTNDVVVFRSTGVSSSVLSNINETNAALSVASDEALETGSASNAVVSTNSSINQSFGYIEVPLEIQYTFVDKRLGLNVIGGFSSFFLDNNEIYSERENGTRTYLGEANNINDISYSANLGFGLNYKFSKKIDLNLEPTFKYQFNTFNNTSGDFTPFFIGVYTGFAIKF